MIDENLKNLVRDEAAKLKEFATKKELERLDFGRLNPSSIRQCIYGQMAGDCFSQRAKLLLNNCTAPYSESNVDYEPVQAENFKRHRSASQRNVYYSPIEFYITQDDAKNANLIAYLKGETETLDI
jgi:hypothetical protein